MQQQRRNRFIIAFAALYLSLINAVADDISDAINASEAGMRLQSERIKVAAENIANYNIPAESKDKAPYKRKVLIARTTRSHNIAKLELPEIVDVKSNNSEFILKYEPYHPSADEKGFVKYPNINIIIERAEIEEARRSFEANMEALKISKVNQSKIIEAMK